MRLTAELCLVARGSVCCRTDVCKIATSGTLCSRIMQSPEKQAVLACPVFPPGRLSKLHASMWWIVFTWEALSTPPTRHTERSPNSLRTALQVAAICCANSLQVSAPR